MKTYIHLLLSLLGTTAFAQGSSRHLSLDECIKRAGETSYQKREIEADLDVQSARKRGAYAQMGPNLRAEYTDVDYDEKVAIDFAGAESTLRPDRLREGSLILRQPLTGLYHDYENAAEARAREEWQSASLKAADTEATFSAAESYRRSQQARELVKIAESSLAATESQEKDAESLLRSGRLMRSDLLRIQMAQQDAKAQLASAIASEKRSMERLRYMLALDPRERIELDPLPTSSHLETFSEPAIDKALMGARSDRAEFQQAQSEVERAGHARRATESKFLPDVDVFLRWDRIFSEELPFGTPRATRSLGIAASWELWDNGSRFFAMHEAQAEERKAQLKLHETEDRFRLELESLMADLAAARQNLEAAKSRISQAEEAYRIDKARFVSGFVTTTDLLLSEANLTRARGAWVDAVVNADLLVLNLKRAMGSHRPV